MSQIPRGRWTAEIEGDFVVFIIGAKVRNPVRARRAVPLLIQMRAMLRDLERDPSKGLLGYQMHGGPLGVIVQYWRSFEDLERFARNPSDRHAKVWHDWFASAQHHNSAVGIWHETYKVRAGEYEAIYQGMNDNFGLMRAGRPLPLGRHQAAATRMGATESTRGRPVDLQ
ncbi:MAG: DUF4188 domain-containing protein [Actinobacteria bacterium]|nr:DUF4188 domain-containing protein [Actinomycetota bacterium]